MTRTRISLAAAALLFGAHRGAEAQRVQIGSGLHGGGSIQTLDTRAESGRVTQLSRAWGESQRTELLWLGASHGGLWKSFEDRPGHVASWSVVTDNFPGSHTRGSFLIHSFAISFDGGANWAPYGTGIPVEKDGRISLATSSDGRFVFALVGGDHVMKGVFRLAFHFFDTAPRWMAYSTNGQRLFSVDGATALSGDQTCGGKDNRRAADRSGTWTPDPARVHQPAASRGRVESRHQRSPRAIEPAPRGVDAGARLLDAAAGRPPAHS